MNKAIFIDKDGTLISDIPYNINPELVTFEKYAFESLRLLYKQGFCLIIITNQPGIGFGYFKHQELKNIEAKIKVSLLNENITLHGFYYCPHVPLAECNCHKPKPGLILKAARDMRIDLCKSWMIGDILNDVEAGNRSGCKTVLIDNGNETEWLINNERRPDFIAKHLKEAAEIIMLHQA